MAETNRDILRLWLRLLSSTNFIEYELQQRLREKFGISLARFDFLAQLYRAGDDDLTMTDLSQRLMVTGGNITGLTDRLTKEGYVQRRPDADDRRVQRIRLTDQGRAFFEEVAEIHGQWVSEIFAHVETAGTEGLMGMLGQIKSSAEHAAKERTAKKETS